MDSDDRKSLWHGLNFVIALIAVILIIIFSVIIFQHRSDVEQYALGWRVVNGTTTGSSENFIADTNTMYIGQSSQDLTLTLQKGTDFIGGVIGIKNNTTNTNITIVPGTGVVLEPNQVPVVTSGAFSEWLLTEKGYLRLDNPTGLVQIGLPSTPIEEPIINNNGGSIQNPLTGLVTQ